MSRRAFIRWLLAAAAAALALVFGLRQRGGDPGEPAVAPTASPSPAPSRAATPSPTPAPTPGPDEPLLSFMILSDLHVNSAFTEQSDKLRKALDDIVAFESKVERLIVTGDLTDAATDGDYKELHSVLSGYKLPQVAANMGNHDYYDIWIDKNGQWNKDAAPNGKSDAASRDKFLSFFGMAKPYSEMEANGYTILLLSQETYVQEKPEVGEGAWYSDEQLTWFEERMSRHRGDKPIFVMIHQPLPPIGQDGSSHQLIRAKRFRDILRPHANVFVFSGHQHQDFLNGRPHYVKETFHWFHNSSVGKLLNASFQQTRKEAAQGLYVQVYKGKVVLRGREFSNRTWVGKEADWTVPLDRA
ncbi:MAG: metallophosphoesterase [Paenibacillaceae bacterium]|nr:metallophosphoesterase [Paenibacillaceae bacterium]